MHEANGNRDKIWITIKFKNKKQKRIKSALYKRSWIKQNIKEKLKNTYIDSVPSNNVTKSVIL